ncbi:uncharacterized protein CBL_06683 [Carabus blaptoides fortunei]
MADRVDRRNRLKDSEGSRSGTDEPPNSRLFIVCSKQLTEDDFRSSFSRFGEIEEIWVVKDRSTGDRKGVTYIKYSKTSEAAAALEAMNGKTLGSSTRHIKVMIAASREQGSKREGNEEERVLRLFVIVPKTMTDDELYDHFKQFGDIDYASIIRDKETKESKGFAYIKFFKFSHAANAFENCDRKFKAVFAEPRRNKQTYDFLYDSKLNSSFEQPHFSKSAYSSSDPTSSDGYTKLQVIASPTLNQDQMWKLFDIVPGLDYCHVRLEGNPRSGKAVASVVYTTHQWASYAKDKLHGFEYPPGHRLIVKPDPDIGPKRTFSDSGFSGSGRNSTPAPRAPNPLQTDLAHLAETIAQATSVIQAAGLSTDVLSTRLSSTTSSRDPDQPNYCNVKLPAVQSLADIDADTVARCFIVCTPQPPPIYALRDVFCRFGHLIDVYMLTNRNCGYAKYANKDSAEQAIKTLHGAEICGIRLKVLEAEEPRNGADDRRKRLKVEEH